MADDSRICDGCAAPLTPMKRPGNPKRFCSEKCRVRVYYTENPDKLEQRRAASRERAQKRVAAREAALPPRPQCKNCGVELRRRRATWKYCNAAACQSVMKARFRESGPRCSTPSCDSPVIAKGLCGSHYSKVWRSENLDRSRDNRRARKARVRDAFVEPVLASEVFERDGWICGLCSAPISRDAVWPDLLSPSVDHIVPLSRGGEHSMANVQASHLSCNSRKQASVPVEAVASVS